MDFLDFIFEILDDILWYNMGKKSRNKITFTKSNNKPIRKMDDSELPQLKFDKPIQEPTNPVYIEKSNQPSNDFITGLIIIAIAANYADDDKIDANEQKIIDKIIDRYKKVINRDKLVLIKQLKKNTIKFDDVIELFDELTISKVDINNIVRQVEENLTKANLLSVSKTKFLDQLQQHYK